MCVVDYHHSCSTIAICVVKRRVQPLFEAGEAVMCEAKIGLPGGHRGRGRPPCTTGGRYSCNKSRYSCGFI